VALLATLALAAGSLGILFYRAVAKPQPSRVIVVRGTADWKGLELTVTGGNLDAPQVTKFEELGNFVVPFFLGPGKYKLLITNQEVPVFSREVDISQTQVEVIDLVHLHAATQPATQPSTSPAAMSSTTNSARVD
jgi:hypothetical protein